MIQESIFLDSHTLALLLVAFAFWVSSKGATSKLVSEAVGPRSRNKTKLSKFLI